MPTGRSRLKHRPQAPLLNRATDTCHLAGLGLYEYMQLAEALGAQPIWVINNGIAHEDAVATSHIAALVQDALDALDFILGPADSKWGALRASMGHSQPWSMQYMGIGNEVRT